MLECTRAPLIGAIDVGEMYSLFGNLTYIALAAIAVWGAYCVIMVWRRISQQRFRTEQEQSEFLNEVEPYLAKGDFDEATRVCEGDPRAVPQLTLVAIRNREIGHAKVKRLVMDRFQRDVLSELEQRLSWINTVIKAAPMLGLFGTVLGMMGAFGKLALGTGNKVGEVALASDISLALVTTACGLTIAIPLIVLTASINIRLRKLEDLVASGVGRVLDVLRETMTSQAYVP